MRKRNRIVDRRIREGPWELKPDGDLGRDITI
jgi:hypothetical protein